MEDSVIKINELKIREYGKRGYEITIPAVWVKDLKLESGDLVELYRDEEDRLILVAKKEQPVAVS